MSRELKELRDQRGIDGSSRNQASTAGSCPSNESYAAQGASPQELFADELDLNVDSLSIGGVPFSVSAAVYTFKV